MRGDEGKEELRRDERRGREKRGEDERRLGGRDEVR